MRVSIPTSERNPSIEMRGATLERLDIGRAIRLQLLPGAVSAIVFVLAAQGVHDAGLPVIFTLAIAMVVGEIPSSWVIMIRQVKRETGGRFRPAAAFPWLRRVPWWVYVAVGVPFILFSTIMMAGVVPAIGAPIRHALFGWVPGSMVMEPDPAMLSTISHGTLISMWLLSVIVFAGIGGITQELYSRGFLLPRTEHLGVGLAPPLNAVSFAVFHLIAPWNWIPFTLMVLPWSYLVWWRRSVKIGLFIHVGTLLIQSLMMGLLAFGVVQVPAG